MTTHSSADNLTDGSAAGLRAVILAGGRGTRLLPYTINFPKPLVPVGDVPIIELLMRRLALFGINDVTLTLGHMAELVKAYFEHRDALRRTTTLRYVVEEEPFGTAGSVRLVSGLDTTFFLMNGDLLTNLDFESLLRFHREKQALLTIATHQRRVKVDLGVLEFDSENRIVSYLEKPETTYYISMGIYVCEPAIVSYIQPGVYLDFPDLVLDLIRHEERIFAYPSDCLWLDIGRPDDYARAQDLYAEKSEEFERV